MGFPASQTRTSPFTVISMLSVYKTNDYDNDYDYTIVRLLTIQWDRHFREISSKIKLKITPNAPKMTEDAPK